MPDTPLKPTVLRRLKTLYDQRVPIETMADRLHLTKWRIRTTLREQGWMRRAGKPPVTAEEKARRIALGLTVTTWEEYGALVPTKNPRLDRRLGVRLLCWRCRKRPSTTSGVVGGTEDPTGARRPLCSPCKKAVSHR